MKKVLKTIFAVICLVGIIITGLFVYATAVTLGYKLDEDKLIQNTYKIEYLDFKGNEISTGKSSYEYAKISEIPKYVTQAFVAIEDKRFFNHNGIDTKGLLRAAFKNVKSGSFKQGGSTISQQLIKNTHLSHKKTITRKLIEIKLTKELEKKYSKEQILEMYLNSIYFGENSYGICNASKLYFNKEPQELTISEAATLACIINAPSIYSPYKNPQKCLERRNLILKLMNNKDYITSTEYATAIKTPIETVSQNQSYVADFYIKQVKNEFDEISNVSPYDLNNCKIYTYYEPNKQKNIANNDVNDKISYTAIALNNDATVSAYYSNASDEKRQAGSVIKPIAVYAPAIEENLISEKTPILDEKTDFNGYSPSNYADKYYGYISASESLQYSSNVCAVKILNYLTPTVAAKYLKKSNIKLDDDDENLSLALGSTKYGITLKSLAAAYTPFINGGNISEAKFIDKIVLNGKIIYKNTDNYTKVYSEDTCQMMNVMCENVVKNGTAKKIGVLKKSIAGKTGTVGTKSGNSDAYCISYSTDCVLGVRLSGDLGNEVTGGGLPANYSCKFWQDFCCEKSFSYDKLKKANLDLIEYNESHNLILANEATPERYVLEGYFKNSTLPKKISNRFITPEIKTTILSGNNYEIKLKLCHAEYIDFTIYRKTKNEYEEIFDSTKNALKNDEFLDKFNDYQGEVVYKIIPYFENNGKKYYGKESIVGPLKIQSSEFNDWWDD